MPCFLGGIAGTEHAIETISNIDSYMPSKYSSYKVGMISDISIDGANHTGYIFSLRWRRIENTTYVVQYFIADDNKTFQRMYDNGTWTAWTNTLGYTSLSGLASALGVDGIKWDSYTDPFPGTNFGIFKVAKKTDPTTFVELAIQCEDGTNNPSPIIKVRSTYSGTSSSWHTVFTPQT